jgi:hypothetical protein
MTEEINPTESVVEAFLENETGEPEEVIEESTEEVESDLEEEIKDDEPEEEVQDEEEDTIIDEEEESLGVKLHGVFSKEHISLLERIEDVELRDSFIEAGKKQRADIDRKSSEIGSQKKLYETLESTLKTNNLNYTPQQFEGYMKNLIEFDALFTKNPKEAVRSLAKHAKIDLQANDDSAQDDDDDYRTPEEIKSDARIEALEQQLKNQESQRLQQEINNFANTKDVNGDLKYPYFDKVRADMALFYPDRTQDLSVAYKKAVMLNEELSTNSEVDILKKVEVERKARIEKAKKQKKQSVRSSKINTKPTSRRAIIASAVDDFYSAG